MLGLGIVCLFISAGIFAHILAPYDPDKADFALARQGPSAAHWLGNDELGRDMLSRLIYGARLSLLVGLIPLYVIALLYGALILKLKEANAMIRVAQWTASFLMGLFFPIAVFPVWLRVVALSFPPTWLNNGVRASLLGVGYFFQAWYLDIAMLGVFCVIAPWVGYWLFAGVERGVKREEGIGQF